MTKILGFAGKKQSGKNTCCNFLQMLKFHEYGVCKNASLNEQGQILVSDLFGEQDPRYRSLSQPAEDRCYT